MLGPLRKSTGWESIIQVPVRERTNLAVLIAKIKKSGKVKRQALWYYQALQQAKNSAERRTLRSKTFKGIAEAMATQWTNL